MIYYPANYYRDFYHEFDSSLRVRRNSFIQIPNALLSSYLALDHTHRKAQNICLNGLRAITHFGDFLIDWRRPQGRPPRQYQKMDCAYNFLQTSLSTINVGLSVLHPTYGMAGGAISDILANARQCLIYLNKSYYNNTVRYKKALKALARIILSALTLASIFRGSLELTIITMTMQIVLEAFESVKHFRKGKWIVGVLELLSAGIHVSQVIPQGKLLYWVNTYKPQFEAVLKQDTNGFVYLDINDDFIKNLHQTFAPAEAQLPPYFGPGKAGAHISVILKDESQPGQLALAEIGQSFAFRLVNINTVQPKGFTDVNRVWFLTTACSQMGDLRAKYGLSSRIHGDHDFHLTFAVQKS